MPGAAFNNGKSKQDVGTPREFIDAVEQRFGPISVDLAATAGNKVCHLYIGPDADEQRFRDSLAVNWKNLFRYPVRWLNPPFGNVTPWVKKCAECRLMSSWTLLLVPASVGSKWWDTHVRGKSMRFILNPRIRFVGHKDQYPKDLALCAFGYGVNGEVLWRWK